MLIIALVLALIGLVALVFAVVTSNELVAWVCIGASLLGVILLIVDAIRERQHRDAGNDADEDLADLAEAGAEDAVDYPEEESGVDEPSEHAGSDAAEESTVAADHHGEEGAR
ncbi:hypothetical protein F0Q45_10060 [Mycobacterium simiae]|uniref:Transmembrane protein n=1 Tax=Mycobacterium simiae TaxID=1784 RepID=A0A5B1BSN4_MYCSI|nr:hypothetical protein [Mycobacterium simiae]KAA1250383.1 hypothetical protein F0Q45_10060 [Mycobacterium simiae]